MLPNEVMVGRYPRALQRLLSIQGEVPTPQLSAELIPTIEVPTGPELRFLLAERLVQGGAALAAPGAGNYSRVAFANAATSNSLAVMDQLDWYTANGADLYVTLNQVTQPGALGYASRRDPRVPGNPLIQPVGNATAIAPSTVGLLAREVTPNATWMRHEVAYVIPPGWVLTVTHGLIAVGDLYVVASWRERGMGQLETQDV